MHHRRHSVQCDRAAIIKSVRNLVGAIWALGLAGLGGLEFHRFVRDHSLGCTNCLAGRYVQSEVFLRFRLVFLVLGRAPIQSISDETLFRFLHADLCGVQLV